MITIKRVYDTVDLHDGYRVLIDRLWPRGVKRDTAAIDLWAKAIAPSTELRQWYDHKPERWEEFQIRYHLELSVTAADEELTRLRVVAETGHVTLLTANSNENKKHGVVILQRLLGTQN